MEPWNCEVTIVGHVLQADRRRELLRKSFLKNIQDIMWKDSKNVWQIIWHEGYK